MVPSIFFLHITYISTIFSFIKTLPEPKKESEKVVHIFRIAIQYFS